MNNDVTKHVFESILILEALEAIHILEPCLNSASLDMFDVVTGENIP